jgi:hypothetical protein
LALVGAVLIGRRQTRYGKNKRKRKKKLRKQKSISIFTSRAAPPFFFFSQKRKTACAHKINFTARHTHREGGEGKER